MRLLHFRPPDNSGVRIGALWPLDTVVDVRRLLAALPEDRGLSMSLVERLMLLESVDELLFSDDLDQLDQALAACARAFADGRLKLDARTCFPESEIKVKRPIMKPGKMVSVGRNFGDHLIESISLWAERGRHISPPLDPTGFIKLPSSLADPCGVVVKPPDVNCLDYEVELAVVIAKRVFCIKPEEADACVAGYSVILDLADRATQQLDQEMLSSAIGKNLPTFAPMGPALVTPSEIAELGPQTIKLWVNGELRQSSTLGEMIFTVNEAISHYSRIGLDPGDVILMGTPAGVAIGQPDPEPLFLRSGDRIQAEISQIGRLSVTVEDGPTPLGLVG